MRIHHLNCISACPLGGVIMDGVPAARLRGRLTSHCLLVESPEGLVLVDTGYGLRDVADPQGRLSWFFRALNAPELRDEMTAVRQIEKLGFRASDVRHIVLSHLDFDHAGGLDDFPEARVHLLRPEVESAAAQRTWLDRMRYRPQQWGTASRWTTYEAEGEPFHGFTKVRALQGVSDDIILVPLIGHTLGHAGVAIHRGGDQWLFYAGDAYFYHAEMHQHPSCTPGLRFYQTLMEKDRAQRLQNQARLRALAGDPRFTVFCAHDLREFNALAKRQGSAQPTGSHRHAGHVHA